MTTDVINADVTVVGSGLLGLATAFELLERGLTVTVVGPHPGRRPGRSPGTVGAMLPVFSEVTSGQAPGRAALDLAERLSARDGYEAWLERVGAAGGQRPTLTPGVWVVANAAGADDAADLKAIARAAERHGHRAEFAGPGEVPGMAPRLPTHEALWLPYEASVDASAVIHALAAAVRGHARCHWVESTATGVGGRGEHMTADAADGSATISAHLVLAAGAAIPALLAGSTLAGPVDAPPARLRRGVAVLVRAPSTLPAAVRSPNRGSGTSVHLVRGDSGATCLGPTRTPVGPDRPDDDAAAVIHHAAVEIHTALLDAAVRAVLVRRLTVTEDRLPVVGVSGHPMVHLATGVERGGVLLAPRVASLVADGITDPGRHVGHPYSPRRETAPLP